MASARLRAPLILLIAIAVGACAREKAPEPGVCHAEASLEGGRPGEGSALVFAPDPLSSSGQVSLGPGSLALDGFRKPVGLERLSGRGVLQGEFVDVRNGLGCQEQYGAASDQALFHYSHREPGFQEAMAYYHGDQYRKQVADAGFAHVGPPLRIVAHCMRGDNAYYLRGAGADGLAQGKVCLGDSVATPGASYADDASVIVHELQHAVTGEAYSRVYPLGALWYDEAGALNEAISDFAALAYAAPSLAPGLDPRTFSPWALGLFMGSGSRSRGAQRCPSYSAGHAQGCPAFPAMSADANQLSFTYPDGVGWPMRAALQGQGALRAAFLASFAPEELHVAGIPMAGLLWEIYEAIGGGTGGQRRLTRWILEALTRLPKPSALRASPATFTEFAQLLLAAATDDGATLVEQELVRRAIAARGFDARLAPGWLALGSGVRVGGAVPWATGVHVEETPATLRAWWLQMGLDPRGIPQGVATGGNGRPDPGEVLALWLDLANRDALTAGGVQVSVRALEPEWIQILDERVNLGYLPTSGSAQVTLAKIFGTRAVSALASADPAVHVPAGASYFRTQPYFERSFWTAVWARVASGAPHGVTAHLEVRVRAGNAAASAPEETLIVEIPIP